MAIWLKIMKLSALQAGFNLDHIALESPSPNELSKFYKKQIIKNIRDISS